MYPYQQVVENQVLWSQWWFWLLLLVAILVPLFMWILPVYNVWSSRKSGEAELARANFAEQVAIAEANARLKSAEMNKKAEIIEAKAVAILIEKIGDALQNNEGYLRWQWIKNMSETENEVIYVPTEAGLPILEAGKRTMRV